MGNVAQEGDHREKINGLFLAAQAHQFNAQGDKPQ